MSTMDRGETGPSVTEELLKLERLLGEAQRAVRAMPTDRRPSAAEWLETAATVGESLSECRDTLANIRQDVVGGARFAILVYLRQHTGEVLTPSRLEGVAAIRAWPRRIRELRQIGWDITMDRAGNYCLRSDHRERHDDMGDAAAHDEALHAVTGTTSSQRLIEYLLHTSPWPVSGERLAQVAKTPTWRQDLKELVEQGWLIESHEDNPEEIPPGFHRLGSLED
ncbi:hypothetical protein ACFPZ0_01290 [Streptomonospora nanhaiensis]|uniref:hypothetical protein n=1 Tax=Streptomonospora nanhaiensis TaxID=1323731 RepID=UPI001C990B80|nr:hypothetical protein [Streptomonospora nanhaiensis]MBX9387565.1 hypothetical protein [Streptomonospora nanhaiensis]